MDTPASDRDHPPPPETRPGRRALYAELVERHEGEHLADTRARRRFWIRMACVCWLWALVGLVLGAWAFHTTDAELGRVFLLAGQVVTVAGVLGTLLHAAVETEKRGWR